MAVVTVRGTFVLVTKICFYTVRVYNRLVPVIRTQHIQYTYTKDDLYTLLRVDSKIIAELVHRELT